jgi:hypothetical protein
MLAASRIRDQVTPPDKAVVKSFDYVRVSYFIERDLTAAVIREYGIRTSDQPLHFWTTGNSATSFADEVEYLDDMDFKVKDHSGREVVYLPTKNDPRSKEVVLYFLPRVESSESEARKIEITYKWPSLLRQLRELGYEDFTFALESKQGIPELQFRFLLESGTGENLEGEVTGPHYANEVLENNFKTQQDGKNWAGFVYGIKGCPPGLGKYKVTARLKKP